MTPLDSDGQQFRRAALPRQHETDRPEKGDVGKLVRHAFNHRAVTLAHTDFKLKTGGPGNGLKNRLVVGAGSFLGAAVSRNQHHPQRRVPAAIARNLGVQRGRPKNKRAKNRGKQAYGFAIKSHIPEIPVSRYGRMTAGLRLRNVEPSRRSARMPPWDPA